MQEELIRLDKAGLNIKPLIDTQIHSIHVTRVVSYVT